MKVAVIIPTLDEEATIEATLAALGRAAAGRQLERVVVDGGSRDATVRLATRCGAHVLESARGRALQMNAGAAESRGDPLLFLHADTLLAEGAFEAMEATLNQPDVVCGSFPIRFDKTGFGYSLTAMMANLRTRLDGTAYGDQALFVRREAFERVDGFPEVPLGEDLLLARRLQSQGRYVFLPAPAVITSARRLERRGLLRNALRNAIIRLGFELGVSPGSLARLYELPEQVPDGVGARAPVPRRQSKGTGEGT